MSMRIEIKDLNVYYGKFRAVDGVTMDIEPRSVTAFIGPSGCGKSTLIRTLNRMHEVIPGAYVEGQVLVDGNDLYADDVDPVLVRRQVGMVFQRPNPFPTMSIRDNVLAGVKLNNRRISKSDAEDLVEKSLRGANLWEEVKGPPRQTGFWNIWGTTAETLYRASNCGRARGDLDGRAVLGPGPHLYTRD